MGKAALLVLASLLIPSPSQAQVTWTLKTSTNVPPGRSGHAMAYDIVRDRVVLYGGLNSMSVTPILSDTWEWDGSNWTQMSPANVPPRRYGHALAFDFSRRRVVLFGGEDGQGMARADTWEWDGTNWTQMSPAASPSGRREHAMVFDPIRRRILLFGGFTIGPGIHGDTWEWDGVNWTQLQPPASPPGRRLSPMTQSPTGRVLLFGGGNLVSQFADTWEWDGLNWNQLPSAVAPPARESHGLAYDSARNRCVLFGGYDATGGGRSVSDTWEWDGTTWTQRFPAASPSARDSFDMKSLVLRGRVLLFGGSGGRSVLADLWEYGTVATYANYGSGCPGSTNLVPSLAPTGLPISALSFSVNLGLARPQTVALLLTGFQQASVDLGSLGAPGCTVLTTPIFFIPVVTDGAGAATVPFQVPNDPSLVGGAFFQQFVVLDAQANAAGLITTPGGKGTIAGL